MGKQLVSAVKKFRRAASHSTDFQRITGCSSIQCDNRHRSSGKRDIWRLRGVAICVSQTGSLFSADAWNNITFTAGEVKDPRRNVPLSLALGTFVVITLYLLANVAYLAVLPVEEIRHSKLVAADVADKLVGPVGVAFVSVAVMISTFGTLNGSVMTGSRVLFATAADGLLFKPIARVDRRFRTPGVAIWLSATLGVIFVLAGTFEQLADTFVTAIVPFYALAVAAVFILRRRPDYDPPFRVPGYPVVPAIFIIATILLLGNAIVDPTSRVPTLAVLGVILIGIPIFLITKTRRPANDS